MRRATFFVAVAVIFTMTVFQDLAWAEYWACSYNARMDTKGVVVEKTTGGGFIVAGNAASSYQRESSVGKLVPLSTKSILVVKLRWDGSVQWKKLYGSPLNLAQATSIVEVKDGYIVAGYYMDKGIQRATVMKLNPINGSLVWQRSYPKKYYRTIPSSMVSTGNGEIVVADVIDPVKNIDQKNLKEAKGPKDRDFWLMKLRSDGASLWQKTYDSDRGLNETAVSITKNGSKGFFIAGNYKDPKKNNDIWVLKVDAKGNYSGAWKLGETGNDQATSICSTSTDGFFLTGFTSDTNSKPFDVFVIRFDTAKQSIKRIGVGPR